MILFGLVQQVVSIETAWTGCMTPPKPSKKTPFNELDEHAQQLEHVIDFSKMETLPPGVYPETPQKSKKSQHEGLV